MKGIDDCSANKRTPEIIRGFAHDGVRFIQGTNPPRHWLAKNWSYNQLLKEASGKFVLFCGVDIRFNADSIRLMVEILEERHKKMISLVPEMPHQTRLSLIQPMRYWWELVPGRRLFNRPPVFSSCWIAERESIDKLGGLEAVSRSIVPESFFAKSLIEDDGYSFIRASNILGISSYKNPHEQRLTAIRIRYPQLHRRPELVLLFSLVEFTFLLLPFVLLIIGWFLNLGLAEMLPIIISCITLVFCYELIIISTIPKIFALSMFTFPFAVISDITLMNYSMVKYELSTVNWKGRNICLPVMYSTPS